MVYIIDHVYQLFNKPKNFKKLFIIENVSTKEYKSIKNCMMQIKILLSIISRLVCSSEMFTHNK